MIDPHKVDSNGRTNKERMERGQAPLGTDDQPVNLHHMNQRHNGPLVEISATKHREGYHALHISTDGSIPSDIDRKAFDKTRRKHWKKRAEEF